MYLNDRTSLYCWVRPGTSKREMLVVSIRVQVERSDIC